MATGTTGLPVAVVRTMIVATLVVPRLVAVIPLTRLLGLAHGVWPTLDRQVVLTVLQLTLLQRLLLLALLLLKLLLALLLLLLRLVLLSALAILLLTLLVEAVLLVLLLLALLLLLLLLALLLVLLLLLTLLLLALLVLLLLLLLLPLIEAALLALIETALLVLLLVLFVLLLFVLLLLLMLLLLLIVIVGQHLSTAAQGQKTDTCQSPDARVHAFLTAAGYLLIRLRFGCAVRGTLAIMCCLRRPIASKLTLWDKCLALSNRGHKKRGLDGPLLSLMLRPGATLLTSAHLASSSGQCVARWPGQPCRAGGRGWPDSAGRAGRYVRAVILVKRIGLTLRHRIANIADENITCAIFHFG
jgi:hypothetical protein